MSIFKETCMNIKSKHYKNIQCPNKVVLGEYCSKHAKNPIRFSSKLNISASLIQKIWRKYSLRKLFSRQGPARNYYSLANNNTELYSLEPLETIPKIYFFSFHDNKNIWAFDIRTLSYLVSKSKKVQNPYTRDILTPEILTKIKVRIQWLKHRKYNTIYTDNTSFTSEQIWNQNVLEIFTKMEESGYIVNSDWFHDLEKDDHIKFYRKLYDIWNYRLGLTMKEKNAIVPGFNSKNKLFKHFPDEISVKEEKYLKKLNLNIIQKLVSSSTDKTQVSLGVMYVLMALCYVHNSIADAFPWIYASIV